MPPKLNVSFRTIGLLVIIPDSRIYSVINETKLLLPQINRFYYVRTNVIVLYL